MIHYNFNPFKLTIVKFVIIFSLIIVIANTFILAIRAVTTHQEVMGRAAMDSERVTTAIARYVELTFLAVDVVLKRAVEKHQSNLLFGSSLSKDTHNNIISWVNDTPQISAMLMADSGGKITAIYRKQNYKLWMDNRESIFGEPYFASHIDNYDSLYVGKSRSFVKGNMDFIVLSRRLNKLDGSFDGVIMAIVNNKYVESFFSSMEKNKQTKLILSHANGGDLLNPYSPLSDDNKSYANKKKQFLEEGDVFEEKGDSVVLDKFPSQPDDVDGKVKTYSNDSSYSDGFRLYSFVDIPPVFMRVAVVSYGVDMLKEWKGDRLSDVIFFIIFVVFVFVVGFFSLELAKKVQKLRVSERKALAASKAKSDFLANMSHELRTPLNAIIGFSEMLTSEYFGSINDKQKERLNDIHGCGNHLLGLINEVLDFSKGQAGKLEVKAEELEFFRVVREVVRLFSERSGKESVTIENNVGKDLPYLFVDRRKIKQIMINLLSNAVKFSNEGGKVIVSAKVDEKNRFVITVEDSGIGMAQEDVPKALSAFGQVHQDSAIGGTGLGLPLCKIFAEIHGGDLVIDSELGRGTTVTVILPEKVMLNELH